MKKISLCTIAGNAEKYIERFLDSFQPYFDEVIVVRAIGNQVPDRTLDIAKERGCVVGEYINKQDWPHVDDFGAARNMSFDLASGDFLMWADMDDLLENGEAIRGDIEAMGDEFDSLGVPYDVRDDKVRILRERVIRRGYTRWINPIHESLDIPKDHRSAQTNSWQIVHAPLGDRKANDERNLRILESILNPTGSQKFHLFQSLRAVGRTEDAVKIAMEAITNPPEDLGDAEIYELLMSVGQMTTNPAIRGQVMLQAVALDPSRREAYGEMAIFEMANGRPHRALGWVEAMESHDMPDAPAWNMRRMFYGWLAPHLRGMALRMLGRAEEADYNEINHVIRAGAKISLLHATRGRPSQASACRRLWLERAANPEAIEHIFGLDINDKDAFELSCYRHVWCKGNGGSVEAWNNAAAVSNCSVLLQLSDDWIPELNWDKKILDAIGDVSQPKVLAVSDGHRTDDLLCMAILTRARYHQQGYMFHPEFFSVFSDNWFSKKAFDDSVVVDARSLIKFEHLHPAFNKAEMDEVYARSNDKYHYITGQSIFNRLSQGVKVSAEIDGWFDFRDTYDLIAKTIPDGGKFVEIGTWKGKSITYIHDRIQDLHKSVSITAVDTFAGDSETGKLDVLDAFKESIDGRSIDFLQMDSELAANEFENNTLDGVFIDGSHEYESVMADIKAWRNKVKLNGFLGGHDVDSPQVQKALADSNIQYVKLGRCWVQAPK